MIGEIYVFTNEINGIQYVGQTVRGFHENRLYEHRKDALIRNVKTVFHEAIREFGWGNFTYEVVDTADTLVELNRLESYYIKMLGTYPPPNGYNMTTGGDNYMLCESSRAKVSQTMRGTTEPMRLMKDGVLYEFDNISQFAREHGETDTGIGDVIRGKSKKCHGFHLPDNPPTVYTVEKDGVIYEFTSKEDFNREHGTRIGSVLDGRRNHSNGFHLSGNAPVIKSHRLVKDGVVYEFDNITQFCREREDLGENTNSRIVKVLSGDVLQHKGYHLPEVTIQKPSYTLEKDGVIYEFDNMSQFAREHGIDSSSVSGLLRGKRKCIKGFRLPPT